MVISRILGGLGNQMFQYAVARHVALKSRQELKLDLSALKDCLSGGIDTPRAFALGAWNIDVIHATERECDTIKYANVPLVKRWWCCCRRKSRPFGPACYEERSIRFDKRMLQIRGDAYIMGYWQSYRYFEGYSRLIRTEFTPRHQISPPAAVYLREITAVNAVSVHVRRGDYVSNPAANAFHGTCDLQYYRDAVQAIEDRVKNPRFFVFSDDLQWAKANLDFVYPSRFVEFVDRVHDVEEIHLMSCCQHNIIANSSFSWWGAWLNDHPNRIVVSPKQWFRDPKIDTSDLIPPDWLRL